MRFPAKDTVSVLPRIFDEIIKSQKSASIVIPAKAGILVFQTLMGAGSIPA